MEQRGQDIREWDTQLQHTGGTTHGRLTAAACVQHTHSDSYTKHTYCMSAVHIMNVPHCKRQKRCSTTSYFSRIDMFCMYFVHLHIYDRKYGRSSFGCFQLSLIFIHFDFHPKALTFCASIQP